MVDVRAGDGAIQEAARRLVAGEPVVIPTETVYGLAAPTRNEEALARVYALKDRPADNPLIAHVLDAEMARSLVTEWDGRCDALVEACWPGPLTLVLGRDASVPAAASGGRSTLAVRAPRHGVARAVIEAVEMPLSAPSANRSGSISPTSAGHVAHDYQGVQGAEDLLVLDGGPCAGGIESTVLDLTGDRPRLLRPGSIDIETIEGLIGPINARLPLGQDASPGTGHRHYAPRTPVCLVDQAELAATLASRETSVVVLGPPGLAVPLPHRHFSTGTTPKECARVLYDALRRADALQVEQIVAVEPPDDSAWDAIRDRLSRAAC